MERLTVQRLRRCLVIAMAIALLAEMALSLSWRLFHDAAILNYVAFLTDEFRFVPYGDVFETSVPGTLLLHLVIGKVVGYGDVAFRLVDLSWLVSLMVVTWFLLRRLGTAVAWAAALGFGLLYMHHGPIMSFQRDCVGMLPVAAALLAASRAGRGSTIWFLVIGGLFGAAASIKPHLAIGLPVVVGYLIAERRSFGDDAGHPMRVSLFRAIPAASAGFVAVVGIPVLWLVSTGGFPAFIEMLTSYLPLYLQMNGEHEVITGWSRWGYLLAESLRGVYIWGGPVLLALYIALRRTRLRAPQARLAAVLGLLALAYAIYPALAGQFWTYHWMPFRYFALLTFALCLLPGAGRTRRARVAVTVLFVLFLGLAVRPPEAILRQLSGRSPDSPRLERVDLIEEFLRSAELEEGDTVQPLEWTNSAIHGLLRARAPLATRFLYDFHFHHHESDPRIRKFRREFIVALRASRPRFMIDVDDAPRPSGPDCGGPFPELDEFIEAGYRVVLEKRGVRIYERTP